MENKVHKGVVSYFDTQKHFGFIECDNNSYYFFLDKNTIAQNKVLREQGFSKRSSRFLQGDEVSFKLKFSNSKVEAEVVEYLGNSLWQSLRNEEEEKTILLGCLKKINDRYFVKHTSTCIFIPVKIPKNDIDIDLVYEERINQLVEFRLTKSKRNDKIKAILNDVDIELIKSLTFGDFHLIPWDSENNRLAETTPFRDYAYKVKQETMYSPQRAIRGNLRIMGKQHTQYHFHLLGNGLHILYITGINTVHREKILNQKTNVASPKDLQANSKFLDDPWAIPERTASMAYRDDFFTYLVQIVEILKLEKNTF